MPTIEEILDRWIDMDRELSNKADTIAPSGGLNVEEFAAKWGVTIKTVYRDLRVFKARGMQIMSGDWDGKRYSVYHGKGVSLFSQNLTSDEHELLAKEKASTLNAEASGED